MLHRFTNPCCRKAPHSALPPCRSQPKHDGQTLLTQVWRRLNLTECDYFGLEFQQPRACWVCAPASLLQTSCGYVVGAGGARGPGGAWGTCSSDGSHGTLSQGCYRGCPVEIMEFTCLVARLSSRPPCMCSPCQSTCQGDPETSSGTSVW